MSENMDLFEVMHSCRAMRRLDSREVPEELLIKLIDAANQAPSGSNMQNARWLVIRDPEVRQKLAELNRKGVESYIGPQTSRPDALPHQSAAKRMRMLNAVIWQMEHMHEIPVLIIACLEFDTKVKPGMLAVSGGSIWPGVQNLLLAARALGLGATPTTLALSDHPYIGPQTSRPDALPHQSAAKRMRMLNAVIWQMEHMHEIPVLIIACLEFDTKVKPGMLAVSGGSIWPGVQNLLLAARALGLGATPTTLALSDHQAVSAALNLPETMGAFCLIPVGYPTGRFGPVTRRPVEEIMRFDQWQ